MNLESLDREVPERTRFGVEKALSGREYVTWVPSGTFESSAVKRVPRYPASIGDTETRSLRLAAARNERRSAQLAVASTDPIADLSATVSAFDGPDDARIEADAVQVRYVGYVPVEETHPLLGNYAPVDEIAGPGVSGDRAPDVVGDPLFESDAVDVPAHRAQGIWFSVDVPADATPGEYAGRVVIEADDRAPTTYDLALTVRDVRLPDPADREFHLDVWFHPDAVAAEHGVDRWSDRHWSLLESYFADLAGASQRAITAPIVHEPWQREWLGGEWRPQTETGFESLVEWHCDGEWSFDFERFDRYVESALAQGVGPSISAYSMLVFRGPQRLSYYDADGEFVVERVETDEDRWRAAWTAFLEAFAAHLDERGWREQTFLAFDERPTDLMEAALDVVERAAPDFTDRIRVAGSADVEPFTDDLGVHYNHIPLDEDVLAARREAGQTTTFYTTPPARHPRTLCYSPAVEARLFPWIAAANDLDGVLRWAYNSWPADVFENPIFRYPQGAEYLVYPGDDGPLSSIRWELLREGIGEYELARLARDAGDVEDAIALGARDHDGREKDLTDLAAARRRLFEALA